MSTIKLLVAQNGTLDQRLLTTQTHMSQALKTFWQAGVPFESITVSQLCTKAHVARQTFYRRYATINEILAVDCVRVFNAFLKDIDHDADGLSHMAHLVVAMVYQNLDFFEEVTWSRSEAEIVHTLTSGLLRVFAIRNLSVAHRPIVAELIARNLLGFAQTKQNYPKLSEPDAVNLVSLIMPRIDLSRRR